MRTSQTVQIVQIDPLFRKSPIESFRRPNNRKTPPHLHYLHCPEAADLIVILRILRKHPTLAEAYRQNSGAFKTLNRQRVKVGWPGCNDVIAQLKEGRLRSQQDAFLAMVNQSGGDSFVARNLSDLNRELAGC